MTLPESPALTPSPAEAAVTLATQGVAVLPLRPGEKAPASPNGINDSSADPQRVAEMFAAHPNAGLGIAPGRGPKPFLVLDADDATAADFLTQLLGEPTAYTAGHAEGSHAGGAHWYVILPAGVTLPNLTVKSAKGLGIDLIGAGGNGYVVAPPTTLTDRPQPYRWNGPIHTPAADHKVVLWLSKLDADEAAARTRKTERAAGPSETPALDEWMRDTEWSELLSADGWQSADKDDRCGCPIWTHPWVASTDRSATAHEEGCPESQSDFPGGALHCWSTEAQNRCGGVSVSKYMYAANVRHGGDYVAVRESEGIPDEEGFGIGGTAVDPSLIDFGPVGPAPAAVTPIPTPLMQAGPQVGGSAYNARGQVLPDGQWIMDAATAARCGWHTPVPTKDDGAEDGSFSPWDRDVFPLGHPCAPDLLQKIFGFSDFTKTVFLNARSFSPVRTGPVALLMTELVRGGIRCDPAFMAMPGSPLSMYVLRIGDSGKGKSVAMRTTKWTHLGGHPMLPVMKEDFEQTRKMGSGQVLSRMLGEQVEETDAKGMTKMVWQQATPSRVWLEEPEMRSLLKRAKGDACVIFDSLNEGWAMEPPGTETMTNGRVELPRPFSVYLTGGMQTSVWSELESQSTGFLQRLLLTAVSDPWRTTPDTIVGPPTAGYTPADIPPDALTAGVFTLPQEVYDALALADQNSAFEHTASDQEWESHLLQVRIRLVCLLAIREGTTTVTVEMWAWTAYLIEHHRRVRAWVMAASERDGDKRLRDKGAEVAKVKFGEQSARNERVQTAAERILEHLGSVGGSDTGRNVGRALSRLQDAYEPALTLLVKKGLVVTEPGARAGSVIVRLVAPANAEGGAA